MDHSALVKFFGSHDYLTTGNGSKYQGRILDSLNSGRGQDLAGEELINALDSLKDFVNFFAHPFLAATNLKAFFRILRKGAQTLDHD